MTITLILIMLYWERNPNIDDWEEAQIKNLATRRSFDTCPRAHDPSGLWRGSRPEGSWALGTRMLSRQRQLFRASAKKKTTVPFLSQWCKLPRKSSFQKAFITSKSPWKSFKWLLMGSEHLFGNVRTSSKDYCWKSPGHDFGHEETNIARIWQEKRARFPYSTTAIQIRQKSRTFTIIFSSVRPQPLTYLGFRAEVYAADSVLFDSQILLNVP